MKNIFYSLLLICLVSSLSLAQETDQKLLPVKVNGKWGFINEIGKLIIESQFNAVSEFSEGLAEINVNNKWGYINMKGKVVIDPQFDITDRFSESLASIKIDDKWGYINTNGEIVIPPQFFSASSFHEGFAAISNGDLWGFIDRSGKVVITPIYYYVSYFEGGIASVEIRETLQGVKNSYIDKGGYIDNAGKSITGFSKNYSQISEGKIAAQKDKLYGYVDKTGKFLITPQFDEAKPFSEGFACVKIDFKWGYINNDGKVVIDPKFDAAGNFSDGLAQIKINGRIGFIDKSGKIVVNPLFIEARDFIDGRAQVVTETEFNGKKYTGWAMIDKTPKYLTPTLYPTMSYFSEGLAIVSTFDNPKKYGYLDVNGKIVIGWVDRAGNFNNGIAKIYIENKMGYIDKTGKYIWEPTE
ncbi:MAG: WG repeat-containing protein [Melioribacteraceae bacterium]